MINMNFHDKNCRGIPTIVGLYPFSHAVKHMFSNYITVTSHDRHGTSNHRQLHCCSTVCSRAHQRKHQSSALLALCEGNPPVTGGFPTQWASNGESVSSCRHHNPFVCYKYTFIWSIHLSSYDKAAMNCIGIIHVSQTIHAGLPNNGGCSRGSFCVCTQPIRDDVTM